MKIRLLFSCFYLAFSLNAQDSLDVELLDDLTYSFDISNGLLSGEGAVILKEELDKTQYTILGDYANSIEIGTFMNWLIPYLDDLSYKGIVLEMGPVSTNYVNNHLLDKDDLEEAILDMNGEMGFQELDRFHIPIPAVKNKVDAEILRRSSQKKWQIIGVHNDSWHGLKLCFTQVFSELSEEDQVSVLPLYKNAISDLEDLYKNRNGKIVEFADMFSRNENIRRFLEECDKSLAYKVSNEIGYTIEKSKQYANKQYYEKNRDRIPVEKHLLRAALENSDFDVSKDKLLMKLNIRHASKGFQPDGFYGIANTLYEMASYYGNQSLHIGFMKRFYMEDGEVKDEMDKSYYFTERYGDIIQMGRRDSWTLIDLRPLMEGTYYSGKYILDPWISELMKQYDMIIIPPTDSEPEELVDASKRN